MPADPYCHQFSKPPCTKLTIIETRCRYGCVNTALLSTLTSFLKNKKHKLCLDSHCFYGFDLLHNISLN